MRTKKMIAYNHKLFVFSRARVFKIATERSTQLQSAQTTLNLLSIFFLPIALSLASCTHLTPEQTALIESAKSIKSYPVTRGMLIEKLQLEGSESQHCFVGIRHMCWQSRDDWNHINGLTISAWSEQRLSQKDVARGEATINTFFPPLDPADPPFFPLDSSPYLEPVSPVPDPNAYWRLTIAKNNGQVVFDSTN